MTPSPNGRWVLRYSTKCTHTGASRPKCPRSGQAAVHPTTNVAMVADDDEHGDGDPPQPASGDGFWQRRQPGIEPEQYRGLDRGPIHPPCAPQHQPEYQKRTKGRSEER